MRGASKGNREDNKGVRERRQLAGGKQVLGRDEHSCGFLKNLLV